MTEFVDAEANGSIEDARTIFREYEKWRIRKRKRRISTLIEQLKNDAEHKKKKP